MLEDWKARFHLDRKRGLHEEFGLPQAKKPGVTPVHTRVLDIAKYVLSYPDSTKGWTSFALAAVQEIRRQNLKIDAIVTTSPPISSHLIGREAKNILGCPWIADLRDLWTQNLGEHTSNLLQIGLEKRTLRQADGLVTVSDPWATRLERRYPEKKIWSITNGFDPDDFVSPPPPLTEEFSISYTGELYAGQRDPTLLFEVLSDLIQDGTIPASELRVRFYGRIEPWLPALVEKYGLKEVVAINGPTPRLEAVAHQRESQVLLLLPWSNPKETGHHSAKLFEYLAAARPILAIGGARGSHYRNTAGSGCRRARHIQSRSAGIPAFRICQLQDQGLRPVFREQAGSGRIRPPQYGPSLRPGIGQCGRRRQASKVRAHHDKHSLKSRPAGRVSE